jgi:hypothetical protein
MSARRPKKRAATKRTQQEPSNALVSSGGNWTRLKSSCHPEAMFQVVHSTANGIYEVGCANCGRCILRIEVGVGR